MTPVVLQLRYKSDGGVALLLFSHSISAWGPLNSRSLTLLRRVSASHKKHPEGLHNCSHHIHQHEVSNSSPSTIFSCFAVMTRIVNIHTINCSLLSSATSFVSTITFLWQLISTTFDPVRDGHVFNSNPLLTMNFSFFSEKFHSAPRHLQG